MRHLIFILSILISTLAYGQTKYASAISGELIINKTRLTISYNPNNKIPNYVGYYLTQDNLARRVKRKNAFHVEDLVPKSCQSRPSDYSGSGYDKGHLSPAANWRNDETAMFESFSMVNICPQAPSFNRIYWKYLEFLEREYAMNYDTLYVVSGTIAQNNAYKPLFIMNYVRVPEKMFKACVGLKNGQIRHSEAWIFVNQNIVQSPDSCKISIDELEKVLGIDLFAGFWFNEVNEHIILRNGKEKKNK